MCWIVPESYIYQPDNIVSISMLLTRLRIFLVVFPVKSRDHSCFVTEENCGKAKENSDAYIPVTK